MRASRPLLMASPPEKPGSSGGVFWGWGRGLKRTLEHRRPQLRHDATHSDAPAAPTGRQHRIAPVNAPQPGPPARPESRPSSLPRQPSSCLASIPRNANSTDAKTKNRRRCRQNATVLFLKGNCRKNLSVGIGIYRGQLPLRAEYCTSLRRFANHKKVPSPLLLLLCHKKLPI